MNLHINGEGRLFPDPAPPATFTLAALIESLSMKSDRVAVELNRDIVARDRWPETLLKDGDRLEIVHFVGGGSLGVTRDGLRSFQLGACVAGQWRQQPARQHNRSLYLPHTCRDWRSL
jgi:thiamine biosynthesis protein ThiS